MACASSADLLLSVCMCVRALPACLPTQVGTGSGHRYGRWRACLLPLTVPLLWFAADPGLVVGIGWLGLVFGCSCAAVGSAIIWATYPASDVPRKALKGVWGALLGGFSHSAAAQCVLRQCTAGLVGCFQVLKRASARAGTQHNPYVPSARVLRCVAVRCDVGPTCSHTACGPSLLPCGCSALQVSLPCWPLSRPSCG